MRIAAIITGVVGALVATCGVAALVIFGTDGVLSTDRHDIGSDTPALVSSSAQVRQMANGADLLGHPSVRIHLGTDQFVGVGRSRDVERYLAGSSYDEVTDISGDPFELDHHQVDGGRLAARPADQSFWLKQGPSALRWTLADGDYRLVVMSADGRTPLATTARFAVRVPRLPAIALGVTLLGALIAGGAVVAGLRRS